MRPLKKMIHIFRRKHYHFSTDDLCREYSSYWCNEFPSSGIPIHKANADHKTLSKPYQSTLRILAEHRRQVLWFFNLMFLISDNDYLFMKDIPRLRSRAQSSIIQDPIIRLKPWNIVKMFVSVASHPFTNVPFTSSFRMWSPKSFGTGLFAYDAKKKSKGLSRPSLNQSKA